MCLGAWWLLIATAALWRRTLWREQGSTLQAVQQARGGELRAIWFGYELRSGALRVRWRGGLRGPATVVWSSDARQRVGEWLDDEGIRRLLEAA